MRLCTRVYDSAWNTVGTKKVFAVVIVTAEGLTGVEVIVVAVLAVVMIMRNS